MVNEALTLERQMKLLEALAPLLNDFFRLVTNIKGIQKGYDPKQAANEIREARSSLESAFITAKQLPAQIAAVRKAMILRSRVKHSFGLHDELVKIKKELYKLENYFKQFEQILRQDEGFDQQDFKKLEKISALLISAKNNPSDTNVLNMLVHQLNQDFEAIYNGIRYLRTRTGWASNEIEKLEKLIKEVNTHINNNLLHGFKQEEQILIKVFTEWIGWVKAVEDDVALEKKEEEALKASIKTLPVNKNIEDVIKLDNALIKCLENMFKHLQNADSVAKNFIAEINKLKAYLEPLLVQTRR